MTILIDEDKIDFRALDIVRRLQAAGHEAYLVGGCLRDLLLGKDPKDFDIVTNAHPEQIKQLFRNCRLIGKRFRLAHIFYGRDIFEVATFRRDSKDNDELISGDNYYGTFEDDVIRRDFTINSLYYNVTNHQLVDRLDALSDIKNGLIRVIGDPKTRFVEDPVRMLRAIRFISKLNMNLEEETATAIPKNRKKLVNIPPARLADECQKLFLSGFGVSCFIKLREYKLFTMLFPDVDRIFFHDNQAFATYSANIIIEALKNTDKRVEEGKAVTLAFVFSAILWPVFQLQYSGYMCENPNDDWQSVMQTSADLVLIAANERVLVPIRLRQMIVDIWMLQARLENTATAEKRMKKVIAHPRFRAAYDFLMIREAAGETQIANLVNIWTEAQQNTELMAAAMALRSQMELKED